MTVQNDEFQVSPNISKKIENQQKHIFWTLQNIENMNIRQENKGKLTS